VFMSEANKCTEGGFLVMIGECFVRLEVRGVRWRFTYHLSLITSRYPLSIIRYPLSVVR